MQRSALSHPIGTVESPVERLRDDSWTTIQDTLAIEAPLEMRLRIEGQAERPISITMRTPGQDADLVLGYLFSEGILQDPADLIAPPVNQGEDRITVVLKPTARVDWTRLERQGYASSSCGVCGKNSLEQLSFTAACSPAAISWQVRTELLRRLPDQLRKRQELFARTGGIHGAGLFDRDGRLLLHREDVGRHNALDKVVGSAFAQGWLPLSDHLLVLSGRASFELIQKAALAGLHLVVAVGAPSSLAVTTATAAGMTLVGFAARDRLNVYCGVERLQHSSR